MSNSANSVAAGNAALWVSAPRRATITELGRRSADRHPGDPDAGRIASILSTAAQPGPSGEIRLNDSHAVWRILLGGETGAGEAYMDGAWESPDLVATLMAAALNRDALGVTSGWLRKPMQVPRTIAHRARRNTVSRQPPQHPCALRPGQRLLQAVPGRDDDVLAARIRVSRSVARRRATQQVPHPCRARRDPRRNARAGDRQWLGWLCGVCRRSARMRRYVDHGVAGAARAGDGADRGSRLDRPRDESSYATIARSRALTTPSSRSRCSRRSAPSTSRRSSRPCDRALKPGGTNERAVDLLSRRRLRARRSAASNWIQQYIFPGRRCCRHWRPIERSLHGTRLLDRRDARHPRALRADARELAQQLHDRLPTCVRSASTSASSGCGTTTCRSLKAGFATGLVQDQQIVLEKSRGI